MELYGVCISDIEKINEEKVMEFLEYLSEDKATEIDYLADFLATKNDNNGDYSVSDWLYDFESNGYYGLAAFLRDVIEEIEEVDITCDDPNGIHYLGLESEAPWNFNVKTRNMTAEEYRSILTEYVDMVTDDVLEIRWWHVIDED